MRGILFRGKTVDTGEWVEGAYYKQTEYYGDPYEAHYIITTTDELEDNMMLFERVDPETVGQFTGLFDKNYKRIFEGDIMRNAGNVVEFYNGSFCINGDSPLSFWTGTEIIGNIHDDREKEEK